MLRRSFVFYVVLPLLILEGYLLSVRLVAPTRHSPLFSENGIIELGTAVFFCVAGFLALGLCLRSRDRLPNRYRSLFLAYAVAAWFVALEETSYGQHLFGWTNPEWFAAHSSKNEINLHNLYGDRLSNAMRGVAVVGFPVGFVLIPLLAILRSDYYKPGHWSYFLLPRAELVMLVLLAQSLTLLDNYSKWKVGNSFLVRPGEVQELFWAMAAAVYPVLMRQRLLASPAQAATPELRLLRIETSETSQPSELRKAA